MRYYLKGKYSRAKSSARWPASCKASSAPPADGARPPLRIAARVRTATARCRMPLVPALPIRQYASNT
jgi:hypothetical protein